MSLSEAMFAKLLVTSLWQNLFCMPKVPDVATVKRDRVFNCAREAPSSLVALEEKLLELAVG